MTRYRKIASLFALMERSEEPSEVIVWNDCNGPMMLDAIDLRNDYMSNSSVWKLWCPVPRPTEAQIQAAYRETERFIDRMDAR